MPYGELHPNLIIGFEIMARELLTRQVNGQLKSKFRCLLGQGLQMRPDRARDAIMACAILHNISKDTRQPEVDFNVQEDKVLHICSGQ